MKAMISQPMKGKTVETPASLQEVFEVRRSIGDPVTSDFVFAVELPVGALQNTAYTTGNGEYEFFDGLEWRKYTLKFGDAYIKVLVEKLGRIGASLKLINNLIAQINPASYLTSGNAGGQSMHFPSLQDVLNYYNFLREQLLEEEAAAEGMNSGLMLKTKRRPVGGVLESE
jgi:hypothetical protein